MERPEPGLYGPRRIAIGPDDSIYVVDQGHNRIAQVQFRWRMLATWGSKGNGDGQFNDPTSVAVDPPRKSLCRRSTLTSGYKYLTKWKVSDQMVSARVGTAGLALKTWPSIPDRPAVRLERTSDAVLIFDLNGARIGI